MDAFVSKLNPTGTALVYSTFLGGTNSEWGRDIAVDTAGNAYVTGKTMSSNFPTTARRVRPDASTSTTARAAASTRSTPSSPS